MRIYIQTDMEGVAGVLDHDNWCQPQSRYYEEGKELLTAEISAAVDGFFAAGATDVLVADGHGAGGVNPRLLDPRAHLLRGWARGWPLGLEEGFDFVACVGQHAKAGTEYSHITHTQWFNWIDMTVNDVSVGEFGQFALCASELGIRYIFASGEEALTREAQALIPGIETVAVKRGIQPGIGDDLKTEEYMKFHLGAIHLHPQRACALIREGTERALRRAQQDKTFGIIPMKPPYEMTVTFRGRTGRREVARVSHPTRIAALMNLPLKPVPEGGPRRRRPAGRRTRKGKS
jgi:D-amino peptidase